MRGSQAKLALWLLLPFAGVAAWIVRPQVQLWRIERDVNRCLETTTIEPYRAVSTLEFVSYTRTARGCSETTLEAHRGRFFYLPEPLKTGLHATALKGKIHLLEGKYDEAIEELRNAWDLAAEPDKSSDLANYLAVSYALRAEAYGHPVDFSFALHWAETAQKYGASEPSIWFNSAVICEKMYLFRLADRFWKEAERFDAEPWKQENVRRAKDNARRLTDRDQRIAKYGRGESLDEQDAHVPGALEFSQEALLASPELDLAAARRLGDLFAGHGDLWWKDFLEHPLPAEPLDHLRTAIKAYEGGDFASAGRLGAMAERAFSLARNRAGRLRARWERIRASHRGDNPEECKELAAGFERETAALRYEWLSSEGRLDVITCRTVMAEGPTAEQRRTAEKEFRKLGFEGLQLRALAFVTEPEVGAESPSDVWTHARDGLRRVWEAAVPAYRIYHFCYSLSDNARRSGLAGASVLLLRESLLNAAAEKNPGVVVSVTADLAGAAAEASEPGVSGRLLADARNHLDQPNSHIIGRVRIQVESQIARIAIASGRAHDASSRIEALLNPFREGAIPAGLNPVEEAGLLNLDGTALLIQNDYNMAAQRFKSVLAIYERMITTGGSPHDRESLKKLYETAFRGEVESSLRKKENPKVALAEWIAFRTQAIARGKRLSIPPHSALLTIAYLPGGISIWFSTSSGVEQYWIAEQPARSAVNRLRTAIASPGATSSEISFASRAVEQLLLGPVENHLGSLATESPPATLMIDAEGSLAQIPWAALENPKGISLLERFVLVRAAEWPSEGVESGRFSNQTRALIFADPNSGNDESFPRLPDARREGEWLAGRLRRAFLASGADADTRTLLTMLPNAELFHFAGHGVFNGGLGGLHTASSAEVDARQIRELRLGGLGLVVLAACSTAAGNGEGMQKGPDALIPAFLNAGAARVIAAESPVDSGLTSEFMQGFYRQLLKGDPPAVSLRSATLQLRRAHPDVSPSVWAAFQIFGAP